jgi:predicted acyl esterase
MDIKKDTDYLGYVKLHLWVEAESADDADIFVAVHKLDAGGNPLVGGFGVAGPDGRLRASHRKLDTKRSTPFLPVHPHREEERLKPGAIVPLDIEVRPIGMHWKAGEKLELIVAGYNVLGRLRKAHLGFNLPPPATRNKGYHIIHTGGRYDSYLQLPVMP